MNKICSAAGCTRTDKITRGMCPKHYMRWRKYGSTESRRKTQIERFEANVSFGVGTLGCWLWLGGKNKDGYGVMTSTVGTLAHRFSYHYYKGAIPVGYVVDHFRSSEGRPRHCVNPDHLQAVTQKQNLENQKGAQTRNRTGVRGVYLQPSGKFQVLVSEYGKSKYYGTYSDLEEASKRASDVRKAVYSNSPMDE